MVYDMVTLTADRNNVSFECLGTQENSLAKNTMCMSSDAPIINITLIIK